MGKVSICGCECFFVPETKLASVSTSCTSVNICCLTQQVKTGGAGRRGWIEEGEEGERTKEIMFHEAKVLKKQKAEGRKRKNTSAETD